MAVQKPWGYSVDPSTLSFYIPYSDLVISHADSVFKVAGVKPTPSHLNLTNIKIDSIQIYSLIRVLVSRKEAKKVFKTSANTSFGDTKSNKVIDDFSFIASTEPRISLIFLSE